MASREFRDVYGIANGNFNKFTTIVAYAHGNVAISKYGALRPVGSTDVPWVSHLFVRAGYEQSFVRDACA